MLPQEGHASSSLLPGKRDSPTAPGPLPGEAAGPALRDPMQPLVTSGNAQLGTRAEGGCFLPGTTPSHQARGPAAISPSSEEARPPPAAPHDGPAPGQVPGRLQDMREEPAIAPARAGATARTQWDHLRCVSLCLDNPAPSSPHQGKRSRHVGGPGQGRPDGTPSPSLRSAPRPRWPCSAA